MKAGCTMAIAAALAATLTPVAGAAVRSSFTSSSDQRGTLRVESDAGDDIRVACVAQQVLVNDAPPDTGPVPCWRAGRIEVLGGPGDNRIDLGGISPSDNGISRGVTGSTLIDGGPGDDTILGPSGGHLRVVGGPGSDWMQTLPGSLDRFAFGPAAEPEHDTISATADFACYPSYPETDEPGVSGWTVPWDALDFTDLAADDPVRADGRGFTGVFAAHRNRTVAAAGGGGVVFEAIAGGAGDDVLANACMLVGGEGDDVLQGSGDAELLMGEAGDDRLLGGAGSDKLAGGTGADRLHGGDGGDALDGGPGDDLLEGWNQSDVYHLEAVTGPQTDTVVEFGGRGVDVLSFDLPRAKPVTVDLASASGVVARAAGLVVRADARSARALEGIVGGAGNDRLLGNDRPNSFWSGGGTDYAAGGRGDDVYYVDWSAAMPYAAYAWSEYWGGPFPRAEPGRFTRSGRGRSFLRIDERPGRGTDTVDVAERVVSPFPGPDGERLEGQISQGVRIDLSARAWIVRTAAVGALTARPGGARHLERVRGTSYDDTIVGNRGPNVLEGRQGRDRVLAGAGRDTCLTAGDRDRLAGCETVRRVNPDR